MKSQGIPTYPHYKSAHHHEIITKSPRSRHELARPRSCWCARTAKHAAPQRRTPCWGISWCRRPGRRSWGKALPKLRISQWDFTGQEDFKRENDGKMLIEAENDDNDGDLKQLEKAASNEVLMMMMIYIYNSKWDISQDMTGIWLRKRE